VHSSDRGHAPLDLVGVSGGYGRGPAVVEDVTVTFPDTGVVQLAGDNGSGKSTLVELASGYLAPWLGSVTVFGLPAAHEEARARRRVVRSRPALFPGRSVRDHLVLGALASRSDRAIALARADRYGLEPWLDADAGSLSAGNTRRLWIVMCTSGTFDLVLLDEPYLGLDSGASAVLSDELTQWSQQGLVVLVTHTPAPDVRVDARVTVTSGHVSGPVPVQIGAVR
jgi:ABC-2 type transport system ATP-binding protein